ncbi:MAG: GDSL-type esterase/lipase family protein, partial [Nanoarchaeota archaeon]|nr:GDSL-type esterase/lipase family protein [Nanoarchaeota archaeon]
LNGVSVFNTAIAGETSTELMKNIESDCEARNPELIIISIGANDAREWNGKILVSEKDFEDNLIKVIKICKKFTNKIIFVGEIPCNENKTRPTIWSDNTLIENFTNENLKKYEIVLEKICKRENIYFIKFFNEWLNLDYSEWLDDDGLHPNEIGYQKIFERVRELLIKEKLIC